MSVLHWDTTSVYLEGEYADSDLVEYEHSSDGFSGTVQKWSASALQIIFAGNVNYLTIKAKWHLFSHVGATFI